MLDALKNDQDPRVRQEVEQAVCKYGGKHQGSEGVKELTIDNCKLAIAN